MRGFDTCRTDARLRAARVKDSLHEWEPSSSDLPPLRPSATEELRAQSLPRSARTARFLRPVTVMIHQWPDEGHDTREAAPVRLTREQRCDIAGIFGAGLMSSAVIVAAAMFPGPEAAPDASPGPASLHAAASSQPAAAPAPVTSPPPVTSTPTQSTARVSTLELRNDPAPQPRVARLQTPARPVRAAAKPDDDPVTRKLTRFFTGDGRHTVKPFPTIDEDDR